MSRFGRPQSGSCSTRYGHPSGSRNSSLDISGELSEMGIRVVPLGQIQITQSVIGQGSRSQVFDATLLTSGSHIAAKSINVFGADKRTRKHPNDLLYYLDIYRKLKHHNVVELLGVSLDLPFVYELTEKCETDLEKFHKQSTTFSVSSEGLYCNIFQDTCRGMAYMHSCGVLHRDLKADNILLVRRGPQWSAKVGDFGLAKVKDSSKRVPRGPVKLNPPEALQCECDFCGQQNNLASQMASLSLHSSHTHRCQNIYPFYDKSDVYMFGLMLYCVSHGCDFFGRNTKTGTITEKVKRGERPSISNSAVSHNLAAIIGHCWSQGLNERPSFSELIPRFQYG